MTHSGTPSNGAAAANDPALSPSLAAIIARRPATERAHYLATRDALLEHARMGRSVSEWRDGRIVDVSPAEVFARYGLDEFGRPAGGG